MIIFELDGTLADCEHRRHFVQAPEDYCGLCHDFLTDKDKNKDFNQICLCGRQPGLWEQDWKAFYEACDQDEVILPVLFQFYALREKFGIGHPIQIWSGRCESIKLKTINWLEKHFARDIDWKNHLKMRPIGDNTRDDQLKEKWLDEVIAEGKIIDFVFDDRPKVIRMWRRRGIFVFNCCQHNEEF